LERTELADPKYRVTPRYWIPTTDIEERIPGSWSPRWLLVWQDVTDVNTMARTVSSAILPFEATDFTVRVGFPQADPILGALIFVSTMNSFMFDYVSRQKIGGTHLSDYVLKQLPLPSPRVASQCLPWLGNRDNFRGWLHPRVLELAYTAWDLEPFARDCGYHGPPFRWDEARRFLLRCELDAAFFHLYLPSDPDGEWSPCANETAEDRARLKASFPTPRDAVAYIMETSPIVKRKDEEKSGKYRTKRVILEIYDAMAEAMRTGIPYQTRLSPPPADPSVAHPWPAEMPMPPQIVPNPLEALDVVADAAWAAPLGVAPENVVLFTLIEVMHLLAGPVDSERVRVAANLVRSPAIATALMGDAEAAEWARVIGHEAQPLRGNVVQISQFQQGAPDLPWAQAVQQLQGSGAIVISSDGKWSAGSRLPATSKQDWIHGRAAVAVHLLSVIEPAAAEAKILAFIRSVEDGTARRAVS
jgi:hypothetical protein